MRKAPPERLLPRLLGVPASVAHSDELRMNRATLLEGNSLRLRDAESRRGQLDVLSGGDGDDLLASCLSLRFNCDGSKGCGGLWVGA